MLRSTLIPVPAANRHRSRPRAGRPGRLGQRPCSANRRPGRRARERVEVGCHFTAYGNGPPRGVSGRNDFADHADQAGMKNVVVKCADRVGSIDAGAEAIRSLVPRAKKSTRCDQRATRGTTAATSIVTPRRHALTVFQALKNQLIPGLFDGGDGEVEQPVSRHQGNQEPDRPSGRCTKDGASLGP